MSTSIFIDTSYVLALVNTADDYHEQAREVALSLKPPFITTEAVLTEIGNTFARPRWRSLSIATLNDLRADPDIEILSVDSELFDRAFALYSSRMDKAWGLTDCVSFVVMQERGLTRVLTTDRHFEQAGFQNVLMSGS